MPENLVSLIYDHRVQEQSMDQLGREAGKNIFSSSPFAPALGIGSRETGSTVPSRVSLRILNTWAESGAY